MTEEKTVPRNRVHRLALAAAIAPILRSQDAVAIKRPVKTYDPVTGETTGETTIDKVQEGLLKLHEIEFDIGPGVRPKVTSCKRCAAIVAVPKTGGVPNWCADCRKTSDCPDCGKPKSVKSKRCRACKDLLRAPDYKTCTDCGKRMYSLNSTSSVQDASKGVTDGRRAGRCATCRMASARRPTCSKCNIHLSHSVMSPAGIAKRKGKPPLCASCKRPPTILCSDCNQKLTPAAATDARHRGAERPRCHICHFKHRKEEAALRQARLAAGCECENTPVTNKRCEVCRRVRCRTCKKRLAAHTSAVWVHRQKKKGLKPEEWPLPGCGDCYDPTRDNGRRKQG